MEFLSPLALLLLPLAALPLFLTRRPPAAARLAVSSLRLWRAGDQPRATAVAARRPVDWLAILQAAAIAALVGAAARPVTPAAAPAAVFVFDVSPSMAAGPAGDTALDRARTAARAEAARFGGARLHVWTSDDPAPAVVRAGDLAGHLATLAAADGEAPLADAVRLARLDAPGAPLLVFSDRPAPAGTTGQWVHVGAPQPNLAITGLALALVPGSEAVDVAIDVAYFGPGEAPARIALRTDAGDAYDVDATLPSGSRRTLVHRLATPAMEFTARVHGDANLLPSDDARFAVRPGGPLPVGAGDALNPYLEQALLAHPGVAVDRTGRARGDGVVICRGCDDVPDGWGAALSVAPPGRPADAPAPLMIVDPAHPLARGLDRVELRAYPAGAPPPGAQTILAAAGAPVLSVRETARGRIVYLTADLDAPALAMSTGLPVMIAGIVDWLRDDGGSPADAPAGVPLRIVRRAAGGLAISGPDGRPVPFRAAERTAIVDAPGPGIYRVEDEAGTRRFAVNVPAAAEADTWSMAPAPADALTTAARAAAPAAPAPPRRLGPLLLGAGVLLLAIEWSVLRRRHAGRRWRLRLAALGLAGLALLDVPLPAGRSTLAVVFAIDQSTSVPLREQRRAEARVWAMMREMRGGDLASVLVFGAEPAIDRPIAEGPPRSPSLTTVAPGGATNVDAALTVAQRVLPAGAARRIVLLSDGRATTGDAPSAAARLTAAGIPLDVVPIGDAPLPVARVQSVQAPPVVRAGEPFAILVRAAAPPRTDVTLTLTSGDGRTRDATGTAGADGSLVLRFSDVRDAAGTYTYHAASAAEREAAPAAGTAVTVTGAPRLLYVAGGSPALPGAARGFGVEHREPGQFPPVLDAYAAVVLDDVAPGALPAGSHSRLRDYVERDGGGLLVLGGAASLAAAEWSGNPLDAALPVDLRPRAGTRASALAYVLLFDKSGSMADAAGGVPKIQRAREAVLAVRRVLPADALFGVIAFDARPSVVLPPGRGQGAGDLARLLRGVEPSGPTAVAPAVELGLEWLDASQADRRRMLLISDGRTTPADAARLREAAAAGGRELSVVAIGADADEALLSEVARRSGGRAYFPDDLQRLPAIAGQDAADAAGAPFVDEPFVVRPATAHPALAGLAPAAWPRLGGYVVGALRGGAEPLLTSHLGDPVLAGWRFGLGRAVLYTAGLGTAWSAGLGRWPDAGRLWSQTLRWVARRADVEALDVELTETDDGGSIVVSTAREQGPPRALADLTIEVRTPDGLPLAAPVHLAAPGLYRASFASAALGTHLVEIAARDAATGEELRQARALYRSGSRERLVTGADTAALTRLTAMTGGRLLAEDDGGPFTWPRPLALLPAATLWTLASLTLYVAALAGLRRPRPAAAR